MFMESYNMINKYILRNAIIYEIINFMLKISGKCSKYVELFITYEVVMLKKKVLIIILPIIIILGSIFGIYFYVNNTIHKSTKLDEIFTDKSQEEKSQLVEEQGIFNILLCGLDSRNKDSDSRTDSMIMASIDTTKKSIKLVSFMRDMYVPIPGHGQTRLNSAYFFGGPELLMKTLNDDFNLNIQYYGTIDFKAFQSMVDSVGGIDVDIKDYELKQLNYYIKEANWNNPIYLQKAGLQHINGQQALSYCRIRKVGNNDYERTERQRRVLSLLIKKAKGLSFLKLPQLLGSVLPYIKTNMQTAKLANLGYTIYKFGTISVDTIRLPGDNMFEGMKINGADVLVPDMDKNVAYIDNFLSANGITGGSNIPEYMANNFHTDDIAIDKRGLLRKTVKIIIPKNSKKSNTLDPTGDPGGAYLKVDPSLKSIEKEIAPIDIGTTTNDNNGSSSDGKITPSPNTAVPKTTVPEATVPEAAGTDATITNTPTPTPTPEVPNDNTKVVTPEPTNSPDSTNTTPAVNNEHENITTEGGVTTNP
jgi:polyisoprenyl-teichoic acid--peptidoglycan teichoic acid transferase